MVRVAIAVIFSTMAAAAVAEPLKTAVFDIELVDLSQEAEAAPRDDQTRRLKLVSDELRSLLEASPQIELVDLLPKDDEIRRKAPLYSCNGCAEDLAKELGAEILVSGIVQKTSNLILSFGITIRNARSGQLIRAGQADIRGNTDESWLRGIRWITKNRLMSEPLPTQP